VFHNFWFKGFLKYGRPVRLIDAIFMPVVVPEQRMLFGANAQYGAVILQQLRMQHVDTWVVEQDADEPAVHTEVLHLSMVSAKINDPAILRDQPINACLVGPHPLMQMVRPTDIEAPAYPDPINAREQDKHMVLYVNGDLLVGHCCAGWKVIWIKEILSVISSA
jgi:hypothetical protein